MGKGGKTTASEEAENLLSSDRFRPFLDESFDAASFASRSLSESHTTAQAQTEQLQYGVAALDQALRSLVLHNQEDLISQTSRLAEAEAAVHRIGLSVRSLQMVAARVRAEVAEPYQQIATRTRQLKNLQATVDLLRHVIHRLKLVAKLRAQMAATDSAGARVAGVPAQARSQHPCPLRLALATSVLGLDRHGPLAAPPAAPAPATIPVPTSFRPLACPAPVPAPCPCRCHCRRHPGGRQGRQAAVRDCGGGCRGRPVWHRGSGCGCRVPADRRRRRAQPDRGVVGGRVGERE